MKNASLAAAVLVGAGLWAGGAVAQGFASKDALIEELQYQGYGEVKVDRIGRRSATATACIDDRRVQLRVGSDYRARVVQDLGRCRAQETRRGEGYGEGRRGRHASEIEADLEQMGFVVYDGEQISRDEYAIVACRNDTRYDVVYDGAPELVSVTRAGPCDVSGGGDGGGGPVDPRLIPDELAKLGYYDVSVDGRRGRDYAISACFGARRFLMRVDDRAEIRAQKIDQRRHCGYKRGISSPSVPQRPSREVLEGDGALSPTVCQGALNWLMFSYQIEFAPGSARLDKEELKLLTAMAGALYRCPDVERIYVDGHTDNVGDPYQNQDLSERRAEAVREVLVDGGASPRRIVAEGFGEDRPIASNGAPKGRQLNRRIELNFEWGRY